MRILNFSIEGNQKDRSGNPIPYKRTLAGKFRKDSVDYMEWKEYVRSEFDHSVVGLGGYKAVYTPLSMPFPVIAGLRERAAVHIKIWWKNNAHGDGDNVLKGIMDALFENDKCVWAGSFESRHSPTKQGRVDIQIELDEEGVR